MPKKLEPSAYPFKRSSPGSHSPLEIEALPSIPTGAPPRGVLEVYVRVGQSRGAWWIQLPQTTRAILLLGGRPMLGILTEDLRG